MKKCEMFSRLIAIKQKFIDALKPSCIKNHDGKSFTRKRSLWLGRLLTIVLRCSPLGLQLRLDDYFEEIKCGEDVVTKQAFSKARTKLDPGIVEDSFRLTASTLSTACDLELFKGKFRLTGVDCSDIALDNAKELLLHFGGSGKNKDCAMGTVSLCYDILNNIILDGGLYPYGTSERDAFRNHLAKVDALPKPEGACDLFINDRGYPSAGLFAELIDSGRFFLMRVRRKFNKDFDLVQKKERVKFHYNGKHYEVRVFNITLDSGEKEILVTNLPKKYLKYSEAKDLYFKRWNIETKFLSLKNKLELENMSGRRVITTYQDFFAKLDLANTLAALEWATETVIEENTRSSVNKHAKTTNENRLISKFTKKYIKVLTTKNQAKRMKLLDKLIIDIAKRPEDVKPGRFFKRKPPRKKKFCDRYKRVLR